MLEEGQIGARITDVVVALVAESLAQAFEFVAGGEIGFSVAGEHALKQAQVIGDARRELLVGAGREIEFASLAAFGFQVLDDGAVVGQVADIEGNAGADFGLDGSFAAQEPERKPQHVEGAAAHQDEQGVHEGVALHQGAVQINAERAARHGRRQLLKGRLAQGNLSHGS